MGIVSFFKKIISRKKKEESVTGDSHRFKSPSIDSASIHIDSTSINQSLNQSINHQEPRDKTENSEVISNVCFSETRSETSRSKSVLLQEDSLKLGVAAGFVGRSLMDIEDQLSIITSQMPTKDWLSVNLLSQIKNMIDDLSQIKNMIRSHEANEEQRFEVILSAIKNLTSLAHTLPQPYQETILTEVKKLKEAQLTPKMKQLITIVEERGEISYEELSRELQITQDALRGLLSRTVRLTDEIERFQKDGKGWVRYLHKEDVEDKNETLLDNNDANRFESIQSLESLLDKPKSSVPDDELSDLP